MPRHWVFGAIRVVSVLGAWLLTFIFLWAGFFYPESWLPAKSYEDPRLMLAILIGFVHLPYGSLLVGLWVFGMVRLSFAISVLIAPVFYVVGSPYGPPLLYLFFVMPSAFIVIAGLFELCWPYGGGKTKWVAFDEADS